MEALLDLQKLEVDEVERAGLASGISVYCGDDQPNSNLSILCGDNH